MTINEIINRIGILRTRANLSARALSLEIGKNASYIHLLESKRNFEPSLSTLLDIIQVCGSTPEEFFYSDMMQFKHDKQTLEFLKTLSPYQKDAIMNLYRK
jgi:transcriptional regulator with XRE-family HTH domain